MYISKIDGSFSIAGGCSNACTNGCSYECRSGAGFAAIGDLL